LVCLPLLGFVSGFPLRLSFAGVDGAFLCSGSSPGFPFVSPSLGSTVPSSAPVCLRVSPSSLLRSGRWCLPLVGFVSGFPLRLSFAGVDGAFLRSGSSPGFPSGSPSLGSTVLLSARVRLQVSPLVSSSSEKRDQAVSLIANVGAMRR